MCIRDSALASLGRPYWGTQPYHYYLWRSYDRVAQRSESLLLELIAESIELEPRGELSLRGRRRMAELYGVEPSTVTLPLTEGEMLRLLELTQRGAPVSILEPLLDFLYWPENPCSLRAALYLRQLRNLPGLREMLEQRLRHIESSLDTAEESIYYRRAKERIEAILRM